VFIGRLLVFQEALSVTLVSLCFQAEEDETSKAMLEDVGQDTGESTAVKELKSIIESAIDEQVSKLRVSIDEKLKMNEANVMSRIGETNKAVLSPPKNEKKGKKK